MSKTPDSPCCGNCTRCVGEDTYGYGWCLTFDIEVQCDLDPCELHEPHDPNTDRPCE